MDSPKKTMPGEADFTDDFEPLFDYRRVQPVNVICLDDDDTDDSPAASPKRRKISKPVVEKIDDDKDVKATTVVNCEEEEDDWLPPPPKIVNNDLSKLGEDSTIKLLRLKKKELASFAQSANDVLQAVEESVKRKVGNSLQSSLEEASEPPSKPSCERAKIVISIQDKEGLKQFRVYMDDKFERLFKSYANKVKLDPQSLVFCFDGDKINPTTTPDALGMEDDDIIEVHVRKS